MIDIATISFGDYIVINNQRNKVVSKVKYVSAKAIDEVYYKIIFEDHSILVISSDFETVYYGAIIPMLENYSLPFPNKIAYKNENFNLVANDYQIVSEICFGNPLLIEGEVNYADYICEENPQKCISLAIVSRTNERADVLAEFVDVNTLHWEAGNV